MEKQTKGAPVAHLIALAAGPMCFAAILAAPAPTGLSPAGWSVAALAAWMAIWWMTEAVPLAATALLPIVVLPMLSAGTVSSVAASYGHPLVFLFLGGFMVAKGIEKWGLHRRIARLVLRLGPDGPSGLIGSIMAATAFTSMWISNTATAMVMVPIAQSIARAAWEANEGAPSAGQFSSALMLGVAFSATIGGMATLVGTPPNALLAGYLETAHGIRVGFAQWMLIGVPVVAVLLPVTWLLLTRISFQFEGLVVPHMAAMVEGGGGDGERLPAGARVTAAVAVLAGLALVCRPWLEAVFPSMPLSDAGIAMTAALLLFAIPSGRDGDHLLGWQEAASIRWDVIVLFGGGLALAGAIEASGLSDWLGGHLKALDALPVILVVLLAMAVIVYLGELASNTAMAAVFLPVAGAAALGLGRDPLELVIPVGIAASLGFMLPVATPPNAIAYGSGEVSSGDMLRSGAILDGVSILIVFALALLVAPLVF